MVWGTELCTNVPPPRDIRHHKLSGNGCFYHCFKLTFDVTMIRFAQMNGRGTFPHVSYTRTISTAESCVVSESLACYHHSLPSIPSSVTTQNGTKTRFLATREISKTYLNSPKKKGGSYEWLEESGRTWLFGSFVIIWLFISPLAILHHSEYFYLSTTKPYYAIIS